MARILIVEDEFLIAEDLKHKLRRLGHTVVAHAAAGEVAVEKAAEMNPELVLMDVRLRGEMNGLEAARRIREHKRLPVVYITAHANSVADRIEGSEDEYCLTKPFTLTQLASVIQTACIP